VYKKVLGRSICGLYQGIANGGLFVFILITTLKNNAISLHKCFGCMVNVMMKKVKVTVTVKFVLNRPRWPRGGGEV
jgi:hypothetical protein